MESSNSVIAKLLKNVAAVLTVQKKNIFQIRAYENAATAIEHTSSDIKDLWEEKKLGEVPGVGENIQSYIDEYFKTGKVKHFDSLLEKYPKVFFELLQIPGVGPKTALELVELGVKDLEGLKKELENGNLVKKGFSQKIGDKILQGLEEVKTRDDRMLISEASFYAQKIITYLKSCPEVIQVDPLGSLRRMVATIGDLDFSASTKEPQEVIKFFTKMPNVKRVLDQGEYKASVVLHNGLRLDLLVGSPDDYGALLQHFTGSKQHNIKLRTYAQSHGKSLSEYGVKEIKTGKTVPIPKEEDLYKMLKMQTPPPEIREDNGEIEAALAHKLPDLIETSQIKGDLHLHSNYPVERPSHGPGVDTMEAIVDQAIKLGYQYVGISDHPPSFRTFSQKEVALQVQRRTKYIQKIIQSKKSIHVLNGFEVDILGDGTLSVPDEALATLDYCIAGIHSGHRTSGEEITGRLLKALSNPYVDIISHPTGRLINQRSSYEADWERIFEYCSKNKKILEINSSPNRLDLRDDLVRLALKFGVKFIINTDAHALDQMANMPFGVSVARRGWVQSKDIVNSWDWKKFSDWFNIKKL